MISHQHLDIAPDVHARQFDDELVVLDLASGNYFGLNEVGAAFWSGIERGDSLTDVLAALAKKFDVAPARLEADIDALIAQLLTRGLVRKRDE